MIYLDYAATSMHKPLSVLQAMQFALQQAANPGRGGHTPARLAAELVYQCRERAGKLFGCQPEQVVFTSNCTHGLNLAIKTLVKPGSRVVISGFEHNAVTRPLHGLNARITVAGRKLFDPADTLAAWEKALQQGQDAAIFTHCSNVFGYILPIREMAALCIRYQVPFAIDAAQSAGTLPLSLSSLWAEFIAMPGHKGLLGPQGTGLLLCARQPLPLLEGGTGSDSMLQSMPDYLPEGAEAGTLNVPGIAGLSASLGYLLERGIDSAFRAEQQLMRRCAAGLQEQGFQVFTGEDQCGTISFLPRGDCEELAQALADRGIALRAGLHCAPLAHESAGTLATGTVRVSFGHRSGARDCERLLQTLKMFS